MHHNVCYIQFVCTALEMSFHVDASIFWTGSHKFSISRGYTFITLNWKKGFSFEQSKWNGRFYHRPSSFTVSSWWMKAKHTVEKSGGAHCQFILYRGLKWRLSISNGDESAGYWVVYVSILHNSIYFDIDLVSFFGIHLARTSTFSPVPGTVCVCVCSMFTFHFVIFMSWLLSWRWCRTNLIHTPPANGMNMCH